MVADSRLGLWHEPAANPGFVLASGATQPLHPYAPVGRLQMQ